jgi:hypothetical protein
VHNPSAIVGCVKTESRNVVYGSPAEIASWTTASAPNAVKAVRAREMSWPMLVAAGKGRAGGVEDIAGYRAGVFPYAVLVDGKGSVAAHGQLSTLVDKLGVGAMLPPRKP